MAKGQNGKTIDHNAEAAKFLTHLQQMGLTLYMKSLEATFVQIPGDKTQEYYPTDCGRTACWLFGVFLDLYKRPPPPATLRAARMHLAQLAYERGLSIPGPEKADLFSDDAVLAALHTWVGKKKDARVCETASKACETLAYYGAKHPNFTKSWPKTVATMGKWIRVLGQAGMLDAINIKFTPGHTQTGQLWEFLRTADSEGMTGLEIDSSAHNPYAFKGLNADSGDLFELLAEVDKTAPQLAPQPPAPEQGATAATGQTPVTHHHAEPAPVAQKTPGAEPASPQAGQAPAPGQGAMEAGQITVHHHSEAPAATSKSPSAEAAGPPTS